ncbi:MAG: NADH-quinone oxidoreductase subunit J [Candidatus Parabeggiatoa sp. nov. 2]|nr:MAG: NADH-quinone oxidoreductase subunit J [Beggiatoa sp. 4572_84]RKZ63625.1 MAG: NADH-quinone oxidoreductase subunit J [Gammaproteobacteria bacterium]HEC84483.1 NADH-quinone oxidoreductase subunit J [Thioploca sp.]
MNGIWLVALPLLGAFLLPIVYRQHTIVGYWTGPFILLINFAIALGLWHGIANGPQIIAMGGFSAPLGIIFYVDKLALLFVIAVVLGTLVLWLGKERGKVQEETLLLLIVAGGCGLALSGDLFNIYVFYEIVALASYGLAASKGSGAGYGASLRFLILGALGSSLLLLGIALIYAVTGTLNLAHLAELAPQMLNGSTGLVAFALILIGLGVKAEVFPVNTWVPEVYATAPARVSALLGGIVSKLALLVVLRLLVLIYDDTSAYLLLLNLGVLGVLTGELAALRATDLRQVLAYSSIGQLGLVAIAFSIPGSAGVIAGIALALHHALVKPALFMLTPAWGGHLKRLVGAAQVSMPGALLFLVLALSLIGIPPLPGFWAKFLLVTGALGTTENVAWYQMAIAVVLIATVIKTAYFMRIARLMFQGQSREKPVSAPHSRELAPALTLVGLLLVSVLTVGPISKSLEAVASEASDRKAYIKNTLPVWDKSFPALSVK